MCIIYIALNQTQKLYYIYIHIYMLIHRYIHIHIWGPCHASRNYHIFFEIVSYFKLPVEAVCDRAMAFAENNVCRCIRWHDFSPVWKVILFWTGSLRSCEKKPVVILTETGIALVYTHIFCKSLKVVLPTYDNVPCHEMSIHQFRMTCAIQIGNISGAKMTRSKQEKGVASWPYSGLKVTISCCSWTWKTSSKHRQICEYRFLRSHFHRAKSFPLSGETRFAKDVTQKMCFLVEDTTTSWVFSYIYILVSIHSKILLRNDQRVYSSYAVFRETVSIIIVWGLNTIATNRDRNLESALEMLKEDVFFLWRRLETCKSVRCFQQGFGKRITWRLQLLGCTPGNSTCQPFMTYIRSVTRIFFWSW